jgi:hypothetical protein
VTSVVGSDGSFRVGFTSGAAPATGDILHVAFARRRVSTNYNVIPVGRSVVAARLVAAGLYATSLADVGFDLTALDLAPPATTAMTFGFVVVDPLFPW